MLWSTLIKLKTSRVLTDLCFVNTINWDLIAKWDSVKNYVRNNKDLDDCPGKSACEEAGCPLGLCWTNTDCQVILRIHFIYSVTDHKISQRHLCTLCDPNVLFFWE